MDLEMHLQCDVHSTTRPPGLSFDDAPVRWHPKITIYRLLVLLTTIGLGVSKAVASARGDVIVSITTEWVSGVAVFVLLYGIGLYDEDHQLQRMKWLFKKDLATYLWSLSYRTDEVALAPELHLSRHPPVTGYRIATTVSVILFGLVKTTLGYFGYSLAANSLDWVYGVILTSALYCLGLYENNSLNLYPTFFSTDYGPYLEHGFFTSISEALEYLTSLTFSLGIIYASVKALIFQWQNQDRFKRLLVAHRPKTPFLDSVFDISINVMIADLLLLAAAHGVFRLYRTFSPLIQIVFPNGLRRVIRRVLFIRGDEELPAPAQRNYPGDNSDYSIVRFITLIFVLVLLGALTAAIGCLSIWISEDHVILNAGWRVVLLGLYVSVLPWALAFMSLWFFLLLFVHTMCGSVLN